MTSLSFNRFFGSLLGKDGMTPHNETKFENAMDEDQLEEFFCKFGFERTRGRFIRRFKTQ